MSPPRRGPQALRPCCLPLVLPFLAIAQEATISNDTKEVAYLLDVPQVVCPGGLGVINLTLHGDENGTFDEDAPYVPTFIRTSGKPVNLTFALWDANGTQLTNGTVVLMDFTVPYLTEPDIVASGPPPDDRRLQVRRWRAAEAGGRGGAIPALGPEDNARRLEQQMDEAAGACETFFLSDGRSPVELPDTWGEAIAAFEAICDDEGVEDVKNCSEEAEKAFQGRFTDPGDVLEANPALCVELLAAHAAWSGADPWTGPGASPRRLKGGIIYHRNFYHGSSGYGYSAVVSQYPFHRLARNYPLGAYQTSYGFAGRGDGLMLSRMAIILPAVGVAGAAGYVGYHYSHETTRHPCDPRFTRNGLDERTCASWTAQTAQSTFRDDLMEMLVIPSDYQPPLTVSITNISGEDYSPGRICSLPPAGAAGLASVASLDYVFFGLTRLELVDDDDSPSWSHIVTVLVVALVACVVIPVLVWNCASICFRTRKRAKSADACDPPPCCVSDDEEGGSEGAMLHQAHFPLPANGASWQPVGVDPQGQSPRWQAQPRQGRDDGGL